MGIQSYIEERFMENEPVGGVLLDAMTTDAPEEMSFEGIDPAFMPASITNILRHQIGIEENDDMETVKKKLRSGLNATTSSYTDQELGIDSDSLEEMIEGRAIRKTGDPVDLTSVRVERKVAQELGHKPLTTPSVDQYRKQAIKGKVKATRQVLTAILKWLDD